MDIGEFFTIYDEIISTNLFRVIMVVVLTIMFFKTFTDRPQNISTKN